jgi:integrase
VATKKKNRWDLFDTKQLRARSAATVANRNIDGTWDGAYSIGQLPAERPLSNGGNIIALQRMLGHADIKQTMRCAHLAADHLEDSVTKNPLNLL